MHVHLKVILKNNTKKLTDVTGHEQK